MFGRLATDRPHQFKVQGLYDFNFGTTVGGNFRLMSGVPISREAAAISPNNFPVQYLGRMSEGARRGCRRPMSLSRTTSSWAATSGCNSLNVANLWNQKTALSVFSTELADVGIAIDEATFYQGFQHRR